MAGGDIAPVEPAVEAPVVEETASNWDFNGQAVIYYQTTDKGAANDLFKYESSKANSGIQLKAVNDDVAYGIGAGVEVSALGTLGLQDELVDIVKKPMQGTGGWISQAYLTYAMDNTSFKLGRQELPKALSPFAFSESWNVFKNTFDAALAVNTDIEDTTLVGAVVFKGNNSTNPNTFQAFNSAGIPSISNNHGGTDQPVFMLTAQNKSIDDLTLTGTYYYTKDFNANGDANIAWVDAQYTMDNYLFAAQGGYVFGDAVDGVETTAFGAKVAGDFDMFKASLAYSFVGDKDAALAVTNFGGIKTPLYTQMIANQDVISKDAQYVKVAASTELYDGNVGLAYGMKVTDDAGTDLQPFELDATYSTKVFDESTTLFAGYVLSAKDLDADKSNIVRVWGRYNF
jgi:hypothetical protein